MDSGSTLFSSDDTNAAAGGGSAVISADALLGETNDDTATATTPADPAVDTTAPTGQIGDPLADVNTDTDTGSDGDATTTPAATPDDDIVPNETIKTNDWSKVGEVKPNEPEPTEPTIEPFATAPAGEPEPEPETQPEVQPEITPEPAPEVPFASELKYKLPGVDDPEKVAFIKTYTEEFDDALKRATDAADDILDAIDRAVHEHSPDIIVPEAAEEFLAKKPADNRVEKFEDAREIVDEVLSRAADAKEQSAKAAEEAARIYDEVQAFKKQTKSRIAELTADPQGQPPQPPQPPQFV